MNRIKRVDGKRSLEEKAIYRDDRTFFRKRDRLGITGGVRGKPEEQRFTEAKDINNV